MLPGSSLERLVCSFSPAGDLFAVAAPDGRLRVFDTGKWGEVGGGCTHAGRVQGTPGGWGRSLPSLPSPPPRRSASHGLGDCVQALAGSPPRWVAGPTNPTALQTEAT